MELFKKQKDEAARKVSEFQADAHNVALVPITSSPDSIAVILADAVKNNVDLDKIEKIVDMHERITKQVAERAFFHALTMFQAECPPVEKKSIAKIATKAGGSYSYRYAELDEINRTIRPHLKASGLSYTWDSTIEGATLSCVCTLRHAEGHSLTATFTSTTDTKADMSGGQKNAAALTFARRQSLIQVLGLTSGDPDIDSVNPAKQETISEGQALDLHTAIQDTGSDHARFLKMMGVVSLNDIPAHRLGYATDVLEQRRQSRS